MHYIIEWNEATKLINSRNFFIILSIALCSDKYEAQFNIAKIFYMRIKIDFVHIESYDF